PKTSPASQRLPQPPRRLPQPPEDSPSLPKTPPASRRLPTHPNDSLDPPKTPSTPQRLSQPANNFLTPFLPTHHLSCANLHQLATHLNLSAWIFRLTWPPLPLRTDFSAWTPSD
ncbi:hypothetical protein PTTG_28887, partial [Puccinia triticina 1-1 BBBD Race 1]